MFEWLAPLWNYVELHHWADGSEFLGMGITIVGFIFTGIKVRKSREASEKTQLEITKVREDLNKINTISEFGSAITAMDEIKRLHRMLAWELLPDRYASLKKSLISIRGLHPNLSKNQSKVIQAAIQNISDIDQLVEIALIEKKPLDDIPKVNQIMSKQIDNLHTILVEIKAKFEREK
jgi:hypothetical protein